MWCGPVARSHRRHTDVTKGYMLRKQQYGAAYGNHLDVSPCSRPTRRLERQSSGSGLYGWWCSSSASASGHPNVKYLCYNFMLRSVRPPLRGNRDSEQMISHRFFVLDDFALDHTSLLDASLIPKFWLVDAQSAPLWGNVSVFGWVPKFSAAQIRACFQNSL